MLNAKKAVEREFTWDDLFGYQQEDRDRILEWFSNGGKGFLNLSDMGTGKTAVSLAALEQGRFPNTIVICPTTLKGEWARQIRSWCGVRPQIAKDDSARRLDTLFEPFRDEGPQIFIINYESFRIKRHRDVLNLYPFKLAILDEAHRIRNRKAQQTKGVLEFAKLHDDIKVLCLTGSPLVNSPSDLYPLLCLAKPDEFELGGWKKFITRYCFYQYTKHGLMIFGERNIAELRERTEGYTSRRTREEALPDLPEKYYRSVTLDMERDQKRHYNQMKRELKVVLDEGTALRAHDVLSQLTRLRQLALDPRLLDLKAVGSKTKFILELVEAYCIEGGRKLVVFSCFETYIELLSSEVEVPHVVVTGKIKKVEERARLVEEFQKDPSCKLFLGTVQSAGEGLTLTAAADVVFPDRWWTPSVMIQAEDRLCRIGQKNAVQIIKLINAGTVDEVIDRILERKSKMANKFMPKKMATEILEDLRHANS